jgi:hypothetical protein
MQVIINEYYSMWTDCQPVIETIMGKRMHIYKDTEIPVERIEMLEQKIGIRIDNVYACLNSEPPNFQVRSHCDITATNGDTIVDAIEVNAVAYNRAGQAIGKSSELLLPEHFLGFDSLEFYFVVEQPPVKVRLFPTRS